MYKKPHDRQWAYENVVIGHSENGDLITQGQFMEILHSCSDPQVVCYAIALDDAVVLWNPHEFEGILNGKTISIREYAKLRRKARRVSLLYIKVYVGGEYYEIDDFQLSL
jgi:hypothetical protein